MSLHVLLTLLVLGSQAPQTQDMAPLPWEPVAVIDGDPVVRGLPRDGIPPIDHPVFVTGADADGMMHDDEPVIGVVIEGDARAYSIWQLNVHEIVNDVVGGTPVVVTWCPLCFTGLVYERRLGDRTVTFGIEGVVWRENQVMYDRETGSWWAQASGRAIRGPHTGDQLEQLPSMMTSWSEWRALHPDTRLLSKRTPEGLVGTYDMYAAYHASANLGVTGLRRRVGTRDPKLRVLGFRLNGGAFAVDVARLDPSSPLRAMAGDEVVIVAGRDTAARVFRGGEHDLEWVEAAADRRLVDRTTGSTWDPATGVATGGPLIGQRLAEVPTTPSYWFAWQAFFPNTTWLTDAAAATSATPR